MDDERTVVDQALDVLLYAPLGLALEAKEMIPKLAERGRGQVTLARLAGKFAAHRGRQQAQRVVDGLLEDDGSPVDAAIDEPPSVDRPFDDYDELDAKQVISLLSGMRPEELALVLSYERHHRGRSTIINRVQQLQD